MKLRRNENMSVSDYTWKIRIREKQAEDLNHRKVQRGIEMYPHFVLSSSNLAIASGMSEPLT